MSAHVDVQNGRRCHCCGEAFDRCRETYRGTPATVDVLAVMDASGAVLRGRISKLNTRANKEVLAGRAPHSVLLHRQDRAVYLVEAHNAARAAMAELIDEARRCADGVGDLADLRAAVARVGGPA